MATITVDTFLDDGTARTAGETWTINGGKLTIRSDTRWHAGSPASMTGSLGATTISATLGGGLFVDGRDVRWLAYDTGSGNVPAIGTTVSQGGVSGYLLGVWASLTSAPTAVGAAMPATGFLKFRSVTGGAFAAGALTGIGASATGADVRGWIEVLFDQGIAITASRKGTGFQVRGDWFYLDNTNGTLAQTVQLPTNGGGTGTTGLGVWVETSPGSNEYEFWPGLAGTTTGWAANYIGYPDDGANTGDFRQQFVKILTGGQMQFGEAMTQSATYSTAAIPAATYTWSADTVTVTSTAHGMLWGENIYLSFTSGGLNGTSGVYKITSTAANTFTVYVAGSGASGNCTGIGRTTVTFTAHGWAVGNRVYLDVTSGTLPDGTYLVDTSTTNSFTINTAVSATTSGNCTVKMRIGRIPASGCKVRVPNVFLRQCATGTRASNATPHATIGTRPDFVLTGAGVLDWEYAYCDYDMNLSQPYNVILKHSALCDRLYITECASAYTVENVGTAMYAALDLLSFYTNACFAGGTITDGYFQRGNAPGTTDHAINVANCINITLTRVRAGIIQFARSSGLPMTFTQSTGVTANDCKVISGQLYINACNNVRVNDLDYTDRYMGITNTTTPYYAVKTEFRCDDVVIDGITFGNAGEVADVHPYSGLLNVVVCNRVKLRNVGTRSAPLSGGSIPVWGLGNIYLTAGNNDDVRIQRVYVTPVRAAAFSWNNQENNLLLESVFGNYQLDKTFHPTLFDDLIGVAPLNCDVKGCGFVNSVTGQTSVYGTHWEDLFTSNTLGRIVWKGNEPTSRTAAYTTVVAGNVQFTSSGAVSMPALNDQIIVEMPYFAKGHTALRNEAPTLTGTNTSNFTVEYQIDTGSGWNGSWKTLNATNLSGETISATGFKLKYRITCSVANTGNVLTYIRINTDSTLAAQSDNLHPLDLNTLTLTGLKNPTEVRVFDAGTTTEVAGSETITGGTFSVEIDAGTYPEVDIAVLSLGYQNTRLLGIDLSNGNVSIPVQQVVDRQYENA